MREAVIVSTARTPIGKAYRGAFNDTHPTTMGGHAVKHAVNKAGIDPAEVVYDRYGVSRESQDAYSLQSQQRTALAQSEGKFDDEIVPMESIKRVVDKETGAESFETVTLTKDEGNRPSTTLEGLQSLKP